MTTTDLSEVYAKAPALADDKNWQKLQGRMEYLLSEQGLKEPNNPFKEYLDKVDDKTFNNLVNAKAREAGYRLVGNQYLNNDAAAMSEDQRKTILKDAERESKGEISELKQRIVQNAALGYIQQDPLPAGSAIIEGGVGGAVDRVMSGDLGGIMSGFLGGIAESIKSLIFKIPGVEKLVTQLNNWVGSQFSAMFSNGKAMSWEEAGKLADAQKMSTNVGKGLEVFSGLDVEAVKKQVEHGMTFDFPAPAAETAAPATNKPAESPPPVVPAPEPDPVAAAPKTEALKPLSELIGDNNVNLQDFATMLKATSGNKDAEVPKNLEEVLANPNVIMVQPKGEGNYPVVFATETPTGVTNIHAVYSDQVVKFDTLSYENAVAFKEAAVREFNNPPETGTGASNARTVDKDSVPFDEIAAQVTQYAKKQAAQGAGK